MKKFSSNVTRLTINLIQQKGTVCLHVSFDAPVNYVSLVQQKGTVCLDVSLDAPVYHVRCIRAAIWENLVLQARKSIMSTPLCSPNPPPQVAQNGVVK